MKNEKQILFIPKTNVMSSIELKIGKENGLENKLNYSIGINLTMILILSIYLFCSKNHYFFEQRYSVEFILGFVFSVLMLSHYISFIKSVKLMKTNLFTIIYRHILNIIFIGWMILAIFSRGAIEIGEISPAIYFLFLVELLHTLLQKSNLSDTNTNYRKINIKSIFFAMFSLMGVILGYFYFVFNFQLNPLMLILNWSVYGIYSSLIALNAILIFYLIFGKEKILS